jgi:hypothetical protein
MTFNDKEIGHEDNKFVITVYITVHMHCFRASEAWHSNYSSDSTVLYKCTYGETVHT